MTSRGLDNLFTRELFMAVGLFRDEGLLDDRCLYVHDVRDDHDACASSHTSGSARP